MIHNKMFGRGRECLSRDGVNVDHGRSLSAADLAAEGAATRAAVTGAVAGGIAGGVGAGVADGVEGDVRDGECLPGTGNCPPVDPPSWALFAAGLRAGLGPALLSAAAKSCPLAPGFAESAEAAPLTCAGSVVIGIRETAAIAFISIDIASGVPFARLS